MAPAVAKNDSGVVTTSSPAPTPSAISATRSASVPLDTRDRVRAPRSGGELALEAR